MLGRYMKREREREKKKKKISGDFSLFLNHQNITNLDSIP